MINAILSLKLLSISIAVLAIQIALATSTVSPIPAPVMPQVATLAPPAIETLTHYQNLLKLERCESGHSYKVVLDSDNFFSYGFLQFHLLTFRRYGVMYGFVPATTTNPEMIQLTKDRDLQFKIADKMVEDGLWYSWKNCWRIEKLPE